MIYSVSKGWFTLSAFVREEIIRAVYSDYRLKSVPHAASRYKIILLLLVLSINSCYGGRSATNLHIFRINQWLKTYVVSTENALDYIHCTFRYFFSHETAATASAPINQTVIGKNPNSALLHKHKEMAFLGNRTSRFGLFFLLLERELGELL